MALFISLRMFTTWIMRGRNESAEVAVDQRRALKTNSFVLLWPRVSEITPLDLRSFERMRSMKRAGLGPLGRVPLR
jgi:hypothetical protein